MSMKLTHDRIAVVFRKMWDHDFGLPVKDFGPIKARGDRFETPVYLDQGDEPSRKVVFVVEFQPGSLKVIREAVEG